MNNLSQSLNLNTAVQKPLFNPTYLNLEYVFNKILEFLRAIFGVNANGSVNLFQLFVFLLTLFFMFIIAYCFVRILEIREEEKKRLSNFPVGQGLFFAGQSHVHIQIEASQTEKQLISTTPVGSSQAPQAIPMDNSGVNSYIDPGSRI